MIRDEDEIQRAHDILAAVALGEVPAEPPSETDDDFQGAYFQGALDALCWVLHHVHNPQFSENLALLEASIKARGYKLERLVQ